MRPTLTTKTLARAIGVSESSLKRWADEGRIRATRTAGGHRRITGAEAVRFIRASGSPLAQPGLLGLADLTSAPDDLFVVDAQAERLYAHLRAGRSREARALILGLYLRGQSVAAIADGPIREAMRQLGELWRHDEAGVFIEHRATEICTQAVQQVALLIEQPAEGMVAVGGAPSRDPYLLPTLLATSALKNEGVQAVNLGSNTPFEALHEAVLQHRPALVWLSVSHAEEPRKLEQELTRFARSLGEAGVMLVLGGQALPKLHAVRGENVHVGQSMAELVAFARGLRAGELPAASSTLGKGAKQ